ncbi:ABC transporter permease [Halioxenophilus sp. WMMB6]|uniref:ABC transporter permease n=1 Tax=Halioxenophilus sp. WMMB6 TaxID=3073815 RepID=UPI00295E57B7|nr:ABC transporter permease [Halioxenophilus sp. WMMB6]
MSLRDYLMFSWQALARTRFKSAMILLAMAFAVASVVTLTALGEGAKRYVLAQFSFLGADVLVMFPGRNETTGGLPPVTGAAARNITLEEMFYLDQRLSSVAAVAPVVVGSAEVAFGSLSREVIVLGTTDTFIAIREMELALGHGLNITDIRRGNNDCLLGETLRQALFGNQPVIGRIVRVQDYRCRVVGVLAGTGDAFGMDLSDSLVLPVASAQRLFNTEALFRVLLQMQPGTNLERAKAQILTLMTELHQGELDVTLVSPDALLSTFGDILNAMTLGVAAIASISLLVAGLLIMNITLITVTQRTQEIGLLKALGASSGQVLRLFLLEALILAALGSLIGLVAGFALVLIGNHWFSGAQFQPPLWALLMAVSVALITSQLFSWLPARRASHLAPVVALQNRS